MKLGELATVRSGLVLSRKESREASAIQYPLLNLRSINPAGYIQNEQLDIFNAVDYLPLEYLSQVGDIIVRLSAPYTAVLIDKTTSGIVISSNFVIIRTNSKELLPEYLFWLLNTPKINRTIYENTSSNMLGAIKAGFFTEFKLDFLPVEKQEKIANMNTLAIKETALLQRLAEEKEHYYSLLISKAHTEMKRGK